MHDVDFYLRGPTKRDDPPTCMQTEFCLLCGAMIVIAVSCRATFKRV